MDIFRFISSKDIRRHLKDLNYQFDALEASWLVYKCADAAWEEKKAAWTWIINNMPDTEVPRRPNCPYRKSLHDTLQRYMTVCDDHTYGKYDEEYDELQTEFFDGFWFDFPTPFKRGNIVCMVSDHRKTGRTVSYGRGPFVLESLITWNLDDRKRQYLSAKGDSSDMVANGWFLSGDGTVYYECIHNYMELEYHHGAFEGIEIILKPLSNYIKGEIDLDLFLYGYKILVLKQKLEAYEKELSRFTKEGLRLAGLLQTDFSHGKVG